MIVRQQLGALGDEKLLWLPGMPTHVALEGPIGVANELTHSFTKPELTLADAPVGVVGVVGLGPE